MIFKYEVKDTGGGGKQCSLGWNLSLQPLSVFFNRSNHHSLIEINKNNLRLVRIIDDLQLFYEFKILDIR